MPYSTNNAHHSALPGILGKIDSLISRLESFILGAGVILMAVATIANVFGRLTFGSIFFVEELNRILIIFITFSGLSYAARHGRHIRMTALFDTFSHNKRKVLMVIITVVTAICMFILAYYSILYIQKLVKSGRVLPALQAPVWAVYIWVPVGFFITGVQYVLTAIKNLISKDVYLSTDVVEGYEESEIEI